MQTPAQILAIDTSQIQSSVCLIRDQQLLDSVEGNTSVAHSESLLPLIDSLLTRLQLKIPDIDAFAVGVGPGSFTGIRIGCSTIKAFAQTLQKPVYAFSSLKALANSAGDAETVAMVNAYQGNVFVGYTDRLSGEWKEEAVLPEEWLSRFSATQEKVLFCGTGAKIFWSAIQSKLGDAARLSEVLQIRPEGIAKALLDTTSPIHYSNLHANYIRQSQAELNRPAAP